jgi:pyruvate formate lyase activating enzyme
MKEAMLYERIGNGRVRCNLCSHRCLIAEGQHGFCNVRVNEGGRLYTTVYGRVVSQNVDPIEKKPLFHFLPGTRAYSVATMGCNFTCLYCQNHTISQYPREHGGQILGDEVSPGEIVAAAVESGCETIAYTYTEPTIFFEYALDTARLARTEGLRNVFVSNGYMTPAAIEVIAPYLDGINIDLKGISDDFYHKVAGGNLRPVLHSIERFFRAGVWVEVTTLLIPGLNDSPQALSRLPHARASADPCRHARGGAEDRKGGRASLCLYGERPRPGGGYPLSVLRGGGSEAPWFLGAHKLSPRRTLPLLRYQDRRGLVRHRVRLFIVTSG